MRGCDLKMSFPSNYKFSECFCFWNVLSWIMKCCSSFSHSNSGFLTSSSVTSPPTLSFQVKIHFIFLVNLKARADAINNFFKFLNRFHSTTFPIPHSFDFTIEKALTINLVLNSLIPTSGSILAGTLSNTGHFSFGDFGNSGPWNDNCGNTLRLHSRVSMSDGFNSTGICVQLPLSIFL